MTIIETLPASSPARAKKRSAGVITPADDLPPTAPVWSEGSDVHLTKKGEVFLAHVHVARETIEEEIERLITMLDEFDGDPDVEENGDEHDASYPEDRNARRYVGVGVGPENVDNTDEDAEEDGAAEPSLGWPALGPQQFGFKPAHLDDDRELDNADAEWSLGSLEQHPSSEPLSFFNRPDERRVVRYPGSGSQRCWAGGGEHDLEDEHDGREEELGI